MTETEDPRNTLVTCVKGHTFLAEPDRVEIQPIPEWLCPDCFDEWKEKAEARKVASEAA